MLKEMQVSVFSVPLFVLLDDQMLSSVVVYQKFDRVMTSHKVFEPTQSDPEVTR